MQLEAMLSRDDLGLLLTQFVPLKIRLGESGNLTLEGPIEVVLKPDSGISVSSQGKVHWPVFGLNVPATLHSLVLRILPAVGRRDGVDALVFRLEIEHADFALLPTALDTHLRDIANAELAKTHVELAWKFGQLFNHVFALPPTLESAATIELRVVDAKVKVTDSVLGFAVSFATEVRSRNGDVTAKP